MKKHIRVLMRFAAFFFLTIYTLKASSIDATATPAWLEQHHVFHDAESARGFVYFNDGFTVLSDALATVGSVLSVRGAIDLRESGVLGIDERLTLDSHTTFSRSGVIQGNGGTLCFNGDITIPQTCVIHCREGLTLDGQGHVLQMEPDAQLFLDNASTVTLRNMIISIDRSYPGACALNVSSSLSKLCFDNVVLNLGDDVYLNNGQFFFHNDVVVSGTGALVYKSAVPSFIAPASQLYFDYGTTFSFAPCTDQVDLLRLIDETASLRFNGASFTITGTGMQLTKGAVYFNDLVTIEQRDYALSLAGASKLQTIDVGNVFSVAFSPNGRYVAVGTLLGSNRLHFYALQGGQLVHKQSLGGGNSVHGVAWSPDGKYLAVGKDSSPRLTIYALEDGLLQFKQDVLVATQVRPVAWSSDGRFLAVGKYYAGAERLELYSFAHGLLTHQQTVNFGSDVNALSWSQDGCYCVVGGADVRLYALVDGSFDLIQTVSDGGASTLVWSPDGNYLAVAGGTEVRLYSFVNRQLQSASTVSGTTNSHIAWSADGNFLLGVGGNAVRWFSFAGGQAALVSSFSLASASRIVLSSDGLYCVIGKLSGANDLELYPILYAARAADQQLMFGDGLDSSHDCSVNVLANAHVVIDGHVFYNVA
ncbi:MAG: hypothetical protein US69_C0021G0005 [candidate division TM6 bacterium GW2011_GWF2_38_10]|nr:MAG: hypothetical protein US69_C0021G0005 [candidate division TM6 bacterium GW2011_GWF2_38_10]